MGDREEAFKIYVDRLKGGTTEVLEERYHPHFLEVDEPELKFLREVNIAGKAYIADDNLLLYLDINTIATIPCAICNSPVEVPIVIKGCYHVISLGEIKGPVFNFSELLRETILLEVPAFAECQQGRCPQRQEISKYLKKQEASKANNGSDNGDYHPFASLDLDKFKPKK